MTRVPLQPNERVVEVAGFGVHLLPFRPIVWVRIVPPAGELEAGFVPFPVIIDSGNNDVFLIPASRFRQWTGVDPAVLTPRDYRTVNGMRLGRYPFRLDLYRRPGGQPVARLGTDQGVTIISPEYEHRIPPKPLLGVRCLALNRLTFSLNGSRGTFSIWQQPTDLAAVAPGGR